MTFFSIHDQVAVVTGGAGVLCSAMCRALTKAGAKVAVLDLRLGPAEALATELGHGAIGLACDVLDKQSLEAVTHHVLEAFGRVDILINGAGGNRPQATTSPTQAFFDLPAEAIRSVIELNLMGTILPSQVFGAATSFTDNVSLVLTPGAHNLFYQIRAVYTTQAVSPFASFSTISFSN